MDTKNESIHVKILSPSQVIFEGDLKSVSSINSTGPFDILPEHANFITIVENQPIVLRDQAGRSQTFNFPLSVLYTTNNNVHIYTKIQEIPQV